MVVSTMYIYVVPYLYETQHPVMFTLYVLYGHYLLVMICFNYFSGVYTNPGTAPRVGTCIGRDMCRCVYMYILCRYENLYICLSLLLCIIICRYQILTPLQLH